jgi:hypothetical protein
MEAPVTRVYLPNRRASTFLNFESMGIKFTTSFSRDEHGVIRQVFIDNHKGGSSIGTLVRDAAIICSFALQHGADINSIKRALGRDSAGRPLGPIAAALDLLGDDQ